MLTKNDLQYLNKKGITPEQVFNQIELIGRGFPSLVIIKPATIKDGIKQLNEKSIAEKISLYEKASKKLTVLKFVPASGAATRMFKTLFDANILYNESEEAYLKISADTSFQSVNYFCKNLQNFAFYNDLKVAIEKGGSSMDDISKKKDLPLLLQYLLTEKGLNYGNLPKGLIKFHKTENTNRTPMEEHLVEGMEYACSGNKVNIHFTVSPQHLELFKAPLSELITTYQKEYKFKFDVTFSLQKPSTDIVAVAEDNLPLRDTEGNMVFRPGGHGALIYNLMDMDADLIFIKNVDNVVQYRFINDTIRYKKALAGILLETKEIAHYYYKKLTTKISCDQLDEAEEFIEKKLHIMLSDSIKSMTKESKMQFYSGLLNRPYRVCGMVANEDEPGGGPYWVQNNNDTTSIQIVEGSQFTPEQKVIMEKSTHFNPVDIVCSTKDFAGNKYDLSKYIEPDSGFLVEKSERDVKIKSMELPGLWNGSMAFWNSIYIEVPLSTFNPVKSVNDLLRSEHLYEKDLLVRETELNLF